MQEHKNATLKNKNISNRHLTGAQFNERFSDYLFVIIISHSHYHKHENNQMFVTGLNDSTKYKSKEFEFMHVNFLAKELSYIIHKAIKHEKPRVAQHYQFEKSQRQPIELQRRPEKIYVRIVKIPNDAIVYIHREDITSNKIILSEEIKINDLSVWNDVEFCKNAVKEDIQLLDYIGNKTLGYCMQEFCKDTNFSTRAANVGRFDIILWARRFVNRNDYSIILNKDVFKYAAFYGEFEVLMWARMQFNKNNCPWDAWTIIGAIKSGRLDIIIWALENGCKWHNSACDFAVSYGRLDILKFAYDNGYPWHRFVRDRDVIEKRVYDYVTKYGRTPEINNKTNHKWAYRLNSLIYVDAAKYGHLEIMEWLKTKRVNGYHLRDEICIEAAKGGHLNVFKWAIAEYKNDCPLNEEICIYAAAYGHLLILEWLHENKHPLNIQMCFVAIRNNQLEVLKWIHANTCLWNERVCDYLKYHSQIKVKRWFDENRCFCGNAHSIKHNP